MVCGAAEQEACPLPGWEDHEGAEVGKPKFTLCALHLTFVVSAECSTHLWWSVFPQHKAALLMSNLTQLRMGNAGSGEGLNATTKTAATHGGNSSSPSALPWLSVSQVLLKQMMSLGELLVASPFYDLPTCFFNSNHNEEVM